MLNYFSNAKTKVKPSISSKYEIFYKPPKWSVAVVDFDIFKSFHANMIFETNSLFVSNFKMASLAPQITVSF
jgi:hypothetical protein